MNIKNVYILNDRAVLFINGDDAKDFLQNIISNDINKVTEKSKTQKEIGIENLKMSVRELTKDDIKIRNLPKQTSGLVITKI